MRYIKRRWTQIELIVEAVFLIALFGFGFFLDYVFAASLSWQFYLFMAFLALILLLPVYLESRRKRELWLFLGLNISLFALQFLPLTPVKPFKKFYFDVKNGMTIQEVQSLFKQHFPKGGRFRQPEWALRDETLANAENHKLNEMEFIATPNQNLHYILDLTDGRYNSEILIVYFKDGKVVGSEYWPD
ncbi:MAG: hypothetical protein KME64_17400 [Scytonematopsis contorta HA4267-MV1]|jgi:hypothetical protein|nr:hypothetical protein [Scytonematopsis contorta HA4267-MV1]